MSDLEKQRIEMNGSYYQAAPAPAQRKFANPAPLGLFSFASTTLILSLINASTDGVTTPNIVVGMALGVGGLCQILAGMWEFATGNTLGATAFSSYGGFWLSYAAILIPGTGVLAGYSENDQIEKAIGFYLASWFIFTFMMLIASLRSNVVLVTLFFFLMITFFVLMLSKFFTSTAIPKAGGVLGVITAFIAYYLGIANMLTPETAFFSLPIGHINKAE